MDLAEGLRQVSATGAPAQAAQAQEFLRILRDCNEAEATHQSTLQAARDLVRAFLHDPDLWR